MAPRCRPSSLAILCVLAAVGGCGDDAPPAADAAPSPDGAMPADAGPFADGPVPEGDAGPIDCLSGSLAGAWTATFIGSNEAGHRAAGEDPSFCLRSGGADIWGVADDFLYVHREMSGDFAITARVDFLSADHDYAKAGLMLRAELAPDAAHAMVHATPNDRGDLFTFRRAAGAETESAAAGAPSVQWFRLSRRGSTITGERSTDSVAWERIGAVVSDELADAAYVGLALTSHEGAIHAEARFEAVAIGDPGPVTSGCGDGLCHGLETCGTCPADCGCGPVGLRESPYERTEAPAPPARPGAAVDSGGIRYRSVDPSRRHYYSNVPGFNADDTLLLLSGGRAPVHDAVTLERIREVDFSGLNNHRAWLNTDAHRTQVFTVSSTAAYLVDVLTDERTLLRDFASELDELAFGPGEGAVSADDRRVALVGRDGDDAVILAFDLQTRSVLGRHVMPGRWPAGEDKPRIDYALISQSGDWVLVNTRYDFAGGVVRWDVAFTESLVLTDLGKHSDACVSQAGDDVLVSLTVPARAYRLRDGAVQELPTLGDSYGGHVSCRNTRRPGWAYISRRDTKELIALRLDDTGTVERFGWHFSTEHDYDAGAHSTVSRDGARVLFNSDWGDPDREVGSYTAERAP